MSELGCGPSQRRACDLSAADFAQRTTLRVSASEPARKPWSTVTTGGARRFLFFAHAARRCMSATESPPPETATAPGQGAPVATIASMASMKRVSRGSAADGFARLAALREDSGCRVWVFCRERGKSGATFLFLARRDQRLAKLQHAIGRPAGGGIFLDHLCEGARCAWIIPLHIGDVADPIDCLRRQVVFWVVVGEAAKRRPRLIIARLREQVHRAREFRLRARRRHQLRRSPGRKRAEYARRRRKLLQGFAISLRWRRIEGRRTAAARRLPWARHRIGVVLACAGTQLLRRHGTQAVFEILFLAVDFVVQFLDAVRERLVLARQIADRILQIADLGVQGIDRIVLVLLFLLAGRLFLVALAEQVCKLDALAGRRLIGRGSEHRVRRQQCAKYEGTRDQPARLGHAVPPEQLSFIGEHLAQNEAPRAATKRAPATGALFASQQCSGTRAARDSGYAAAILRPAILGRLRADRVFLAVGDRFHARGRDAQADQKLLHGIGSAGTEREIVFARAALVAVAFDRDANRGIFLQPGCLTLQRGFVVVLDIVLVESEMDRVPDIHAQIFRASRHDAGGWGRSFMRRRRRRRLGCRFRRRATGKRQRRRECGNSDECGIGLHRIQAPPAVGHAKLRKTRSASPVNSYPYA